MIKEEIYRLYTVANYADTSRDEDDINVNELGYFSSKEKAIEAANEYIKNNFFHSNTKILQSKNESFFAVDFCSYGKTIYGTKIEVK